MTLPPPVPDHLPEEDLGTRRARSRRRSRYDRPRSYVSWLGILIGLALGVSGGLFYTWNIYPVEEVDIAPWQLKQEHLDHYMAAAILSYSYDGDLAKTIARLNVLRLPGHDPIQAVADTACRLASTGYVSSSSGLRAVRAMMTFYRQQGRSGCADTLIAGETQLTPPPVMVLPTPTPMPPASKTPTSLSTVEPTTTSVSVFVPTSLPSRAYDLVSARTFCDTQLPGIIEVRVWDSSGAEIPGMPVRVRWNGGESLFFTGLKPERGAGYADFEMTEEVNYIVEMPGLSDPIAEPLTAVPCYTEDGDESVISYRLIFQSRQ